MRQYDILIRWQNDRKECRIMYDKLTKNDIQKMQEEINHRKLVVRAGKRWKRSRRRGSRRFKREFRIPRSQEGQEPE